MRCIDRSSLLHQAEDSPIISFRFLVFFVSSNRMALALTHLGSSLLRKGYRTAGQTIKGVGSAPLPAIMATEKTVQSSRQMSTTSEPGFTHKGGPPVLIVGDPYYLLQPNKRQEFTQKHRDAGDPRSHLEIKVTSQLLESIKEPRHVALDPNYPQDDTWAFGEKGQLSDLQHIGFHAVQTGVTCIAPFEGWSDFVKSSNNGDKVLKEFLEQYKKNKKGGWYKPTGVGQFPFLFCGDVRGDNSTAVYGVLSKDDKVYSGLQITYQYSMR